MKPWLLNILACPIDKYHPLEAFFFSWETTDDELEKLSTGNPEKELKEKYNLLEKQLGDGTISHHAMEVITDRSGSKTADGLRLAMLQAISKKGNKDEPELNAAHKYMNMVEVREGLLVCSECGRWYPIGNNVEGIPELMPDDLREKDKELKWMEKWRALIPIRVLKQGKPFTLK